jgi:hypothetical protein
MSDKTVLVSGPCRLPGGEVFGSFAPEGGTEIVDAWRLAS